MRATGSRNNEVSDTLSIRFSPDGLAFTCPGKSEEKVLRLTATPSDRKTEFVRMLGSVLPAEYSGKVDVMLETVCMTVFPAGVHVSAEAALSAVGLSAGPDETVLTTHPAEAVLAAVVADRVLVDCIVNRFGEGNVRFRTPFDVTLSLHAGWRGTHIVAWLSGDAAFVSRTAADGTLNVAEIYPYGSEADLAYTLTVLSEGNKKPGILLCGSDAGRYRRFLSRFFSRLECV